MPVFDHTAHKAIWDYLMKHPNRDKAYAAYEVGVASKFRADCPACQAVYDLAMFGQLRVSCREDCPLDWGRRSCTDSEDSLYARWARAEKLSDKSALAKQIRDLPLKKDNECLYETI